MQDDMGAAKAQFVDGKFAEALLNFQRISSRAPLEAEPVAAMALCYYALGKIPNARRMWKVIISREERYLLPRFLRKELNWPDAMLTVAHKVIETVV